MSNATPTLDSKLDASAFLYYKTPGYEYTYEQYSNDDDSYSYSYSSSSEDDYYSSDYNYEDDNEDSYSSSSSIDDNLCYFVNMTNCKFYDNYN